MKLEPIEFGFDEEGESNGPDHDDCSLCRKFQPLTYFYIDKSGRKSQLCDECAAEILGAAKEGGIVCVVVGNSVRSLGVDIPICPEAVQVISDIEAKICSEPQIRSYPMAPADSRATRRGGAEGVVRDQPRRVPEDFVPQFRVRQGGKADKMRDVQRLPRGLV